MANQMPGIVFELGKAYGQEDAATLPGNKFGQIGFDGTINRLGWALSHISEINSKPAMLAETVTDADNIRTNYKYVVFSGMGGSGLSEQLVQTTFGEPAGLKMYSLRTTDPAVIAAILGDIVQREGGNIAEALKKTKIIVSSKSGTTAETNSHKNHFESLFKQQGIDTAGHFMLVTDPGSPMEQEAKEKGYELRYIQLNQGTDIGGRFTAPTTNIFLLPMVLAAGEARTREILRLAQAMNEKKNLNDDTFLQLAAFLYELAAHKGKEALPVFKWVKISDYPTLLVL